MGKEIIIPKNPDGGLYKVNPMLAPYNAVAGDTIVLEGDYQYISFENMQVPPGSAPIRIVNKGLVRIGSVVAKPDGFNSYGMIFYNCVGFIVDGSGDSGLKYGILVAPTKTGPADKFMAQGLGMADSSDYEIKNIQFAHLEAGILTNPTDPTRIMKNIKFHDLHFSDMGNPTEGGRSECFYIGQTSATAIQVHFDGMQIYNNIIDGTTGDGIQVSKTINLKIYGNIVRNYGKAKLQDQNSGIILGGYSTGVVEDNEITDGTGTGIQVFGFGNCLVQRNKILRTSTQPNCDGIYVSRRGTPPDKLQCDVKNNTIDGAARNGIFSDMSTTVGRPGVWSDNLVKNAAGAPALSNCGDVITWPTAPPPAKTLLCTIKVFTDGTSETVKAV